MKYRVSQTCPLRAGTNRVIDQAEARSNPVIVTDPGAITDEDIKAINEALQSALNLS